MTDRERAGWRLSPRTDPDAVATDAVDARAVLEHVESLTVYAWEAPDDADVLSARVAPAVEDVAERFGDDPATAGDLDGVCLAAIQGLRALTEEQRARIEAQEATIGAQRDDIETLRERVEALQATIGDEGSASEESE